MRPRSLGTVGDLSRYICDPRSLLSSVRGTTSVLFLISLHRDRTATIT